MSQTIETVMEQINWRALHGLGFQFIRMSGDTLRIHKGRKNLDIRYNAGSDLYDLSKHTMKRDLSVKTEQIKGVYWDQLQEILAEFFNIEEATV